MCGYAGHVGGGCAGPGEELVDEQRGKLIVLNQLQRLLEVRLCLRREPADQVRRHVHSWHTGTHNMVDGCYITIVSKMLKEMLILPQQ